MRTEYVLYRMDLQDLGWGILPNASVNVNFYSHSVVCTYSPYQYLIHIYTYILIDPILPKPYPYPNFPFPTHFSYQTLN